MSDLIRREDAIKAFVEETNGVNVEKAIKVVDAYLQIRECDEVWDSIRAIRDCLECAKDDIAEFVPSADRPQDWIPCSERLPETDNTNEINEFDVLLAVRPKKHPERTPQIYIGKLRPVEGDDGSGNFWGVKTAPCEWTIWGWSYFQEPEVLAWMPLPKPWKGADDEADNN